MYTRCFARCFVSLFFHTHRLFLRHYKDVLFITRGFCTEVVLIDRNHVFLKSNTFLEERFMKINKKIHVYHFTTNKIIFFFTTWKKNGCSLQVIPVNKTKLTDTVLSPQQCYCLSLVFFLLRVFFQTFQSNAKIKQTRNILTFQTFPTTREVYWQDTPTFLTHLFLNGLFSTPAQRLIAVIWQYARAHVWHTPRISKKSPLTTGMEKIDHKRLNRQSRGCWLLMGTRDTSEWRGDDLVEIIFDTSLIVLTEKKRKKINYKKHK